MPPPASVLLRLGWARRVLSLSLSLSMIWQTGFHTTTTFEPASGLCASRDGRCRFASLRALARGACVSRSYANDPCVRGVKSLFSRTQTDQSSRLVRRGRLRRFWQPLASARRNETKPHTHAARAVSSREREPNLSLSPTGREGGEKDSAFSQSRRVSCRQLEVVSALKATLVSLDPRRLDAELGSLWPQYAPPERVSHHARYLAREYTHIIARSRERALVYSRVASLSLSLSSLVRACKSERMIPKWRI